MRRGTNGEGCHVWCILRVFWRGFTAFSANCAIACACSFSASILSLYLLCVCLGAKTPVPFFLGFCTKKNTLSKKIACRAKMALALCLPMLSPASSKGLRPDVRSRSLLSAGHSATLWAFCAFYTSILALWCAFPIGIEWIRRRHFFPSTQRLDSSKTL